MKNLLAEIALVVGLASLFPLVANAQTNPDLPKPQTLGADTTNGWKELRLKKQSAGHPNFFGLRDPQTGDTLYACFPFRCQIFARPKFVSKGVYDYDLYFKDPDAQTSDTLGFAIAPDSTFHYCSMCDMAFISDKDGTKSPAMNRTRLMTNMTGLEGHRFLYDPMHDKDTYTIQLVEREK